jgi:hypothetical protein
MASFGMLRHVALLRTDVLEEISASFIKLTRIGVQGKIQFSASIFPSSPRIFTQLKEAKLR